MLIVLKSSAYTLREREGVDRLQQKCLYIIQQKEMVLIVFNRNACALRERERADRPQKKCLCT